MKTVVLDDDPTGTQSASNATVLLTSNQHVLVEALRHNDGVYVQTNTRAIPESQAVELVRRVRRDSVRAARRLGTSVRFVLRGDSTLRGHVFAESEVFASPGSIMVFVPAFPAGGRITVDGVHLVRVGDRNIPADQTEYARDPVFPFRNSRLVDYVAEKSGHLGVAVPLGAVRNGDLVHVLVSAQSGSVVVPDAVTDGDIVQIAQQITAAQESGREIVVRGAAPLAAALAGVMSTGYLAAPLLPRPQRTLLVCGSHTAGATAQIDRVIGRFGSPVTIRTNAALRDPREEGLRAARLLSAQSESGRIVPAILMSERVRSRAHNTLEHGRRVMEALTTSVRAVAKDVDVVIAKGGITSAEVATAGIGAVSARVLGQVLPGISAWSLTSTDGHPVHYIVVPGNVGGPDTLLRVLETIGYGTAMRAPGNGRAGTARDVCRRAPQEI